MADSSVRESLPSAGRVAVIILTFNEELNLPQALSSVTGWADEVFILDSFSTDGTLAIAREHGCHVVQHRFEDYAKQRNFALTQLPIASEWVFFLDADEWLPTELQDEISRLIATNPAENGFLVNRRFIWMGRWIRRGYYPSWILRLFRHGEGRCEDRVVNEHIIVDGATGRLHSDLMHEDRRGVGDWIAKHNRYATGEAEELLRAQAGGRYQGADSRFFGSSPQRKRWLRERVWNRLPPLVRPFGYFFYCYILRGAFLEGFPAFTYHVLHAFWYPLLIDLKSIEIRGRRQADAGVATTSGRTSDLSPATLPAGHEQTR